MILLENVLSVSIILLTTVFFPLDVECTESGPEPNTEGWGFLNAGHLFAP